jgi:hypothetical protein
MKKSDIHQVLKFICLVVACLLLLTIVGPLIDVHVPSSHWDEAQRNSIVLFSSMFLLFAGLIYATKEKK